LWRHHDLLFQTGDALAEQRDVVLFGTDEEFLVNSQVIDFYWLTNKSYWDCYGKVLLDFDVPPRCEFWL
jgi:hypothetical protein